MPAIVREIGDETVQTVNARDLHRALQVGRDFSTWMKRRIEQGPFQEGSDFVTEPHVNSQSPNRGTGHTGGSSTIEYHLSLDMGKELRAAPPSGAVEVQTYPPR